MNTPVAALRRWLRRRPHWYSNVYDGPGPAPGYVPPSAWLRPDHGLIHVPVPPPVPVDHPMDAEHPPTDFDG